MTSEQRKKLIKLIPWNDVDPRFAECEKQGMMFLGPRDEYLCMSSGGVLGDEHTARMADAHLTNFFETSLKKMIALREELKEAEPQTEYMTPKQFWEIHKNER